MDSRYLTSEYTAGQRTYWQAGVDEGTRQEQERIIRLIKDYICFDYKITKCDHTACRRNAKIIKAIRDRHDYGV